MKKVLFKDLQIDQVFKVGETEYKKITEHRVSCCRFTNACEVSNENNKMGFKPLTEVEINE